MHPSIIDLGSVLLITQIFLSCLGVIFLISVAYIVVLPSLGMPPWDEGHLDRLEQLLAESSHPLCKLGWLIWPFAFWPLYLPVFLYQRLAKHNMSSTFMNPWGE